jgi:hypothetical protein
MTRQRKTPDGPSQREMTDMHEDAIWVWDLAWVELQDELNRNPTQKEWNDRALEIDRGNQ